MPDVHQLVPFIGVSIVLILTPGPDMLLIGRNALRLGRRGGMRTLGGVTTGLMVHATAAAVGISAVLATSASAFRIVKLAGAAYLIVLGVRALVTARGPDEPAPIERPWRRFASPYAQGLFTNLLNPKLAIFFLTFVPQFVSADDPPTAALVLVALFILMGLAWLVVYIMLLDRARAVLTRPSVQRRIERVTGVLLGAIGVRLVVEELT